MRHLKTFAGSLSIAFSMYSKIPMPKTEWTKERMPYVLCFFPLIGLVMGVILCILEYAAVLLGFGGGSVIYIVIGVILPLIVTGGIHMDGYMDVTDARSSFTDIDNKLKILKDPHIGAFAVIGCVIYTGIYAAAFSILPLYAIPVIGAVYVAERALSALSVVTFTKARTDGLAVQFSESANKFDVMNTSFIYIILCIAFLFIYCGVIITAGMVLTGILVFMYYRHMAYKEFGGITGDLCGYFLQLTELVFLIVLDILLRIII